MFAPHILIKDTLCSKFSLVHRAKLCTDFSTDCTICSKTAYSETRESTYTWAELAVNFLSKH